MTRLAWGFVYVKLCEALSSITLAAASAKTEGRREMTL